MNVFGERSIHQLSTARPEFTKIAYSVLKIKDHSILKGHRPEHEQNAAFIRGRSQLKWPDGKHNADPSMAIDVRTYPLPEKITDSLYDQALREEQFYLLGLYVGIASEMGIGLRTGGDWDQDGEISDNGWDDLFHVEIKTLS